MIDRRTLNIVLTSLADDGNLDAAIAAELVEKYAKFFSEPFWKREGFTSFQDMLSSGLVSDRWWLENGEHAEPDIKGVGNFLF